MSSITTTLLRVLSDAVIDDIAVDSASRLIFYTDSGNDVIGVVTTSGAVHKRVLSTSLQHPNELALDTKTG